MCVPISRRPWHYRSCLGCSWYHVACRLVVSRARHLCLVARWWSGRYFAVPPWSITVIKVFSPGGRQFSWLSRVHLHPSSTPCQFYSSQCHARDTQCARKIIVRTSVSTRCSDRTIIICVAEYAHCSRLLCCGEKIIALSSPSRVQQRPCTVQARLLICAAEWTHRSVSWPTERSTLLGNIH